MTRDYDAVFAVTIAQEYPTEWHELVYASLHQYLDGVDEKTRAYYVQTCANANTLDPEEWDCTTSCMVHDALDRAGWRWNDNDGYYPRAHWLAA